MRMSSFDKNPAAEKNVQLWYGAGTGPLKLIHGPVSPEATNALSLLWLSGPIGGIAQRRLWFGRSNPQYIQGLR
jgi:hypothetical protein